MSKPVQVIHGPNLNMLGKRQPEIYGNQSLDEIDKSLQRIADEYKVALKAMQTNSEAAIVDLIQQAGSDCSGILINPAAYSHTSIAIYDALCSVDIPAVEVHLSNIHARENFREKCVTARACIGIVSGFGMHSYTAGLNLLIKYVST